MHCASPFGLDTPAPSITQRNPVRSIGQRCLGHALSERKRSATDMSSGVVTCTHRLHHFAAGGCGLRTRPCLSTHKSRVTTCGVAGHPAASPRGRRTLMLVYAPCVILTGLPIASMIDTSSVTSSPSRLTTSMPSLSRPGLITCTACAGQKHACMLSGDRVLHATRLVVLPVLLHRLLTSFVWGALLGRRVQVGARSCYGFAPEVQVSMTQEHACGVCTSQSLERVSVRSTIMSAPTSFMVGFTGTPSTAAPCSAASSRHRLQSSAVHCDVLCPSAACCSSLTRHGSCATS